MSGGLQRRRAGQKAHGFVVWMLSDWMAMMLVALDSNAKERIESLRSTLDRVVVLG